MPPQPYEPAFSDLVDLLGRMIETVRATVPLPVELAWQNDAQVLAIKIFRHACSLKQLSGGGTIEFDGGAIADFVDHASIKVVARALLETLLVFQYVFVPGNDSLSAYRHMTWELGGLFDRLSLHATKSDSKAKQRTDRAGADELIAQLPQVPAFQEESGERQKQILRGKWRHKLSWQTLGEAAGFHPRYFQDVYSFLCGYSHSSWASALQISQAKDVAHQTMMSDAILGLATVVLARFIKSYCAYFPAATVTPMSRRARRGLEYWSFDRSEMENHYRNI